MTSEDSTASLSCILCFIFEDKTENYKRLTLRVKVIRCSLPSGDIVMNNWGHDVSEYGVHWLSSFPHWVNDVVEGMS